MVRELYTEVVRWQAQAEQKWLADLLANERGDKAATKIFASNGSGRKGRSKGEGAGMGAKERPSRSWINSGGENPKATVTHSGETKQKWQNKGCKTRLHHVRRDITQKVAYRRKT